MTDIPLPYKIAAGAVAVIAAAAWGFSLGVAWNADDLAECESVIDRVKEESNALEKKHEQLRLNNERVVEDVSNRWADALARKPVVRVRQDCGGSGGMPGLSATTQSTDGLRPSSAEGGLEITFKQCEQLANDSLLDYEWIVTMKEFVTRLHEGGK